MCPYRTVYGRARRPAPTAVWIYFHHSRDGCSYRAVHSRRRSLPLRVLTSDLSLPPSKRHFVPFCHLPRQREEGVQSDFWFYHSRNVCPYRTVFGRARSPAPTAVWIYFHHSRDGCSRRAVLCGASLSPLRCVVLPFPARPAGFRAFRAWDGAQTRFCRRSVFSHAKRPAARLFALHSRPCRRNRSVLTRSGPARTAFSIKPL